MKRRKYFFFILLVIVICISSGCDNNYSESKSLKTYSNNQSSNNMNFKKRIESTANRDIIPGTEKLKGIRYRIYNIKGQLNNQYNYYLNNGEAWDKFISISNMIDKPSTYNLLLFVDYKQSNFKIDDRPFENYMFKMNSNETIEIPFTINKLPNGLHDVLIVIARDPDVKSLTPEYRANTLVNNLLYFRFSIIVNNDSPKSYNVSKFEQRDLKDNFDGLVLNKNANDTNPWFTDELFANDVLDFHTHIGNKNSNQVQKYALITLLDWNQIAIQNKDVHFIEVDKGKEIDIPSDIKVLQSKGVHDITSILILNPFEKVNKYNNQVFVSVRVGLDIK